MKKPISLLCISLFAMTSAVLLTACGGAGSETPADSPVNQVSESKAMEVKGTVINKTMPEIKSDGITEKLISIGLTEKEANAGAKILRKCGVPSIDICEPTNSNATVDGLVAYRGKIDDDRTFWFTIENRKIFYVALNGEDLYDEDKGGYLKNFNDVHIPETYMDETTKIKLRNKTEDVLDGYFPYDTRYYDAWGIGREDDKYMVQCQISDGSIFTDNWIYGCVWYEKQSDSTFDVIGVKIGNDQYKVK